MAIEAFTRLGGLARLMGAGPAEAGRAALLFAALFLLISVMTMVKVVRDAAFLSHFGIAQLSYLMLGMAVLSGIALAVYNRATAGRPRNRVIWALNGSVAASLVVLAFALELGGRHVPVALYAWSGIFGLAVLSEFWLLANDLFHARQAKRLFAVIAAGGVIGGIFGGATSRVLSKHAPVPYLLFLAALELILAAVLCDLAWRGIGERPREESTASTGGADLVRIFRESAYVRGIAVVAVCMTVATTLADWQFKAYAKLHYASHEKEMARFFSVIAIVLGLLSLVLQLIGTNRLLRFAGASGCMRALPVSCGVGAAFMLSTLGLPIAPLVAAAAGSMLIDGVKFSVDRSATELLYTPLPDETRAVAKRFIDTTLDRLAGALAALLWLVLVWLVGVDRPERLVYVSVATLAVVAVWAVAVHGLRGGYVDAYRELIGAAPSDTPVGMVNARGRLRASRLLAHLDRDAPKRLRALRTLTALQRGSPMLGLDAADVEPHIERELDALELLERIDRALPGWDPPPLRTLHAMIKERIVQGCERVVRLLATLYPPRDVTALHRALRRRSERQRAGALEFLAALTELPSKRRLLAVLEASALEDLTSKPMSRDEAFGALFVINDSGLRACVVWCAVSCGVFLAEARALSLTDASRSVRAVARMTLAARRLPGRSRLRERAPKAEATRAHHAP